MQLTTRLKIAVARMVIHVLKFAIRVTDKILEG